MLEGLFEAKLSLVWKPTWRLTTPPSTVLTFCIGQFNGRQQNVVKKMSQRCRKQITNVVQVAKVRHAVLSNWNSCAWNLSSRSRQSWLHSRRRTVCTQCSVVHTTSWCGWLLVIRTRDKWLGQKVHGYWQEGVTWSVIDCSCRSVIG